MLSYHNDDKIKLKFQERFAAHRAADEVVQGEGFAGGRGCFVGCTLDNYDHAQFPVQLGWPEWLARLADKIFEGIPKAEAPQFGTDLLAAVPVGVDLDKVRFTIAIERHTIQMARLDGNTEPYAEQCRNALLSVISYCKDELAGQSALSAAWSAESAAWSAESAALSAESAARSAESAARSAAWSAARSAESAAESAAWSAESAARSAASAAWQTERDALLSALRALNP